MTHTFSRGSSGSGATSDSGAGARGMAAREAALLALLEIETAAAYGDVAIGRHLRSAAGDELAVVTDGEPPISREHSSRVKAAGREYSSRVKAASREYSSRVKAASRELLSSRDQALVRELVSGVTKWKLTLDYMIFRDSTIGRARVTPPILAILRLGVYQIAFLDKIPVSAACNESVKLAKKYGNPGAVRFVNALLRKIASRGYGGASGIPAGAAFSVDGEAGEPAEPAGGATEPERLPDAYMLRYLGVRYSYPPWICERWVARYGVDFAAALMEAGNGRPELTIRTNRLKTEPEELARLLGERGFAVRPGRFAPDALIIDNPGRFTATDEFRRGLFAVQDESSMLGALALGARAGDRVLDMCAAPGGKSGYIAELTGDRADILAADIHPQRLRRVEENIARLGLKSVRPVLMDATLRNTTLAGDATLVGAMDRVLLDAPCSGLGVIRRKPDIKWAKTAEGIAGMAGLQAAMLENAAAYVKPGGVVVYCVCSTEPEEGEAVVGAFLHSRADFEPEDPAGYMSLAAPLPPRRPRIPVDYAPSAPRYDGAIPMRGTDGVEDAAAGLRLFPNTHGTDGFYIARLRRI